MGTVNISQKMLKNPPIEKKTKNRYKNAHMQKTRKGKLYKRNPNWQPLKNNYKKLIPNQQMPHKEITSKQIKESLKYHYLVSKLIIWNKMECDLVFLVYFRLLKLLFHVFNIFITQGYSFHYEDVSLAFVDGHYTTNHFNYLEFVECLSLKVDNGMICC